MPSLTLHFVLITGAMAVALVGCGQGAAPTVAQPPPEVGVLTLTTQTVPVVNELPGRVAAPRVAEVRARAAGILLKREFNEGTDVQAGEVLFRIDPAPMQAAHSSAQANLARAEATLTAVKVKVERLQPLLGTNAISKQDYDDAVAARDQSVADVAAAKAALATAQLNLDYTVVTAPISGRIGRALVTEGALVGQNEATPLAMIQQLDPIHVNLTRPSTELLRLQNDIASGRLSAIEQPTVTLIAPDGRPLPQAGRLVFTEALVDPTTDAVIIRAEFPNPDHLLLPGMYLRARVGQALAKDAIVVPQQAVNRKPEGATVLVLGPEDKLIERKVRVEGTHGNGYVVSEGLKAGERVVVDGLQKARPGISVKAMVWEPPKTGDPATTARTSSAN
ncbi:MAG TPA: efflux RND transporter periplasmic adaptor subunit [Planctomycetota bacterium]|nr:efflux RND transporter periplasmic adaptor subunit [Planctomycetota bacterium]